MLVHRHEVFLVLLLPPAVATSLLGSKALGSLYLDHVGCLGKFYRRRRVIIGPGTVTVTADTEAGVRVTGIAHLKSSLGSLTIKAEMFQFLIVTLPG